ncbi:MAG: 6-bladed beta-propeller [Gemmatimonadetes bacterium]|nr:6-bladed beta-propeller [Gemmatimonadota bacterium]
MRPSISPCTRIAALVILLATLFVRPASAQQRWRLVEDLRIGGADTGAASFNDIRALAVDGKGQIFVLDLQALEIRVFDPRGRFVQRIGRNGEGPGEFRSPNGMLVAPDGKIWVNDIGQERMVVFDTRGKPATHLRPSSWGSVGFGKPPSTRMVGSSRRFARAEGAWSVASIRRRRASIRCACLTASSWPTPAIGCRAIARRRAAVEPSSSPFAPSTLFQLDGAGAIWCGSGSEYHIMAIELGTGAIRFDQTRKEAPAPIPAAARDSAIAFIRKLAERAPPGTIDVSRIPRTYPTVRALDLDDEGRVWAWVRRPGKAEIDVWSRTGTRLATMAAPPVPDVGRFVVVRGGKLYAVERDTDGVPFVVRYALVKR